MSVKHIIFYLVLVVLIFQIKFSTAQSRLRNRIIVKSDPPGAMIYFNGENSFVGITPFKLHPNFFGTYKIIAYKNGYEKRKYVYFFNGKQKGILKLRLSPKTRLKAGFRSLMFPGWGQFYEERKTSGVLLNLLHVGAIIGTVLSIKDYNKAVEDYKAALENYEKNKKYYSLRDSNWGIVVQKHKEAEETFAKKQKWLWLTGGLWLYNIIDSILLFPSFDKEIFNRSLPTISTKFHNGTASIMLTKSF